MHDTVMHAACPVHTCEYLFDAAAKIQTNALAVSVIQAYPGESNTN